jgi:nicotinamidase/pyrazinamidase
VEALIVVDVQRDFCPGGALAVPDGDAVVPVVNRLAGRAELVVATRDWHPADHASFTVAGGPWPVHCVAGTDGASFHPLLDLSGVALTVDKGVDSSSEGYSAFDQTGLEEWLQARGVDRVRVCGLALDYCVKATALDAARAGFAVVVERDGSRAVEVTPGDGERAVTELRAAGVTVA